MQKIIAPLALALWLTALAPAAALADQDADDAPVAMETVTVTASKRETPADEVPASLSVLEEYDLEELGVDDLEDMAAYLPNLYFKTASSGNCMIIRGMSTIDTSLFSPTGLYVDGVAYPLSYMQNQKLFDVERVEVLRGPQGTLYGKNSEAGVINVVLKKPGNEHREQVYLQGGSQQTLRGGLAASGPVTEDLLFYDVSLQGLSTEGFMENEFTGEDDVAGENSLSGRAGLRWAPNRDLDATLTLDGSGRDLGVSVLHYATGPNATDRYKVRSNENDKAYEREFGQSLKVRYALSGMELDSISSHRGFSRDQHLDNDRTATALSVSDIKIDHGSWSQEFRLASDGETQFTWLVGLFGEHEDLDVDYAFDHRMAALDKTRDSESEYDRYAVFGEAGYEILPRLTLTGGLRVEAVHSSAEQTYATAAATRDFDADIDDTEVLPKVSLSYGLNRELTAYATYSQGFMEGGYNFYTATDEDGFDYDAEHTRSCEIGLKGSWLDNRLHTTLAAFYTEVDDKQVREEVVGGGVGAWKFTNAAKVEIKGLEFEARAEPLDGVHVFAGLGYADTKVKDWTSTEDGTPVDYSGNQLPWAPKLTYHLGAGYTHTSGFYVRADFAGSGERYYDAANTLRDSGYGLLDLRLGWRAEDVDVSLWCENVFDEYYTDKMVNDANGYTMVEDGDPRTFGVSLNWRF